MFFFPLPNIFHRYNTKHFAHYVSHWAIWDGDVYIDSWRTNASNNSVRTFSAMIKVFYLKNCKLKILQKLNRYKNV